MLKDVTHFQFIKEELNFLNNIDNAIHLVLEELPAKYKNILQITIGNRFRPLLVYFGYTLYSSELNEQVFSTALALELIHKASIIIDDIIDDDDKRHGENSVHKQYSSNEATIIAIFLIGKSIDLLSNIDDIIVRIFGKTIMTMCNGTLNELLLENFEIKKVKQIMLEQTAQIIQNSLLMGMKSFDSQLENEDLKKIGIKLGYLFQALNDCEPFLNKQFLTLYKGNRNMDFNKYRKNICYSYILNLATPNDKKLLNEKDKNTLDILINKYNIINIIKDEINTIEEDIYSKLQNLEKYLNTKRLSYFISNSIILSKKRAGLE